MAYDRLPGGWVDGMERITYWHVRRVGACRGGQLRLPIKRRFPPGFVRALAKCRRSCRSFHSLSALPAETQSCRYRHRLDRDRALVKWATAEPGPNPLASLRRIALNRWGCASA